MLLFIISAVKATPSQSLAWVVPESTQGNSSFIQPVRKKLVAWGSWHTSIIGNGVSTSLVLGIKLNATIPPCVAGPVVCPATGVWWVVVNSIEVLSSDAPLNLPKSVLSDPLLL